MKKRYLVEVNERYDDRVYIEAALYNDGISSFLVVAVQEENKKANGEDRMTTKQRDALWDLCGRYNVPFREDDYRLIPKDAAMMKGYVEGWVGGRMHNGDWAEEKATIFVGVSPDGRVNS